MDARQHQSAELAMDHRLVIDRNQLLAKRCGERLQSASAAVSQMITYAAKG